VTGNDWKKVPPLNSQCSAISLQRERASAPRPAVALREGGPVTPEHCVGGFTLPKLRERLSAFTLLELLIVVGIIGLLMVLIAPAFTSIKGGTDVTSAAYTIKGVLDTARTYAKANNTYTWVGFYEEDVSGSSTSPATAGTGRIVMSIVASKDGTMLYTVPLASSFTIDAPPNQTALIQVGKLVKIDNLHLKTFSAPTSTPPPLDTFDTRPAPTLTAQIGDTTPATPYLSFHYPVGGSQYAFTKVIQFTPHGEGVVDNSTYFASGATLAPISEIGVEPTHGSAVTSSTPANVVAIQFTGLGGDVKIYRP
jgi:type II secretory pathway pseudopilin PulG